MIDSDRGMNRNPFSHKKRRTWYPALMRNTVRKLLLLAYLMLCFSTDPVSCEQADRRAQFWRDFHRMVWQARFKRACALKLHAWRKECPQAPPKGSLLIDSHQARLRLERASNPDARLNSRIVYEAVRYIPFESSMRNGRETRQAVDIALKQLRKTVLSSISNTDKAALGEKQVDDGLAIIAQMYLEDVHGALRDVNCRRST